MRMHIIEYKTVRTSTTEVLNYLSNFSDYILTTNLILYNRGNAPTFVKTRCQEVLDLTICSISINGSFRDWHVYLRLSIRSSAYSLIRLGIGTWERWTRTNIGKILESVDIVQNAPYANPMRITVLFVLRNQARMLLGWTVNFRSWKKK